MSLVSPRSPRAKQRKALPKTGAVCAQWVRCGRLGCRCSDGQLHGPYHYLFWREGRRLRKRYIRKGDAQAIRAAYDELREKARARRRSAKEAWGQLRAARGLILEALSNGRV